MESVFFILGSTQGPQFGGKLNYTYSCLLVSVAWSRSSSKMIRMMMMKIVVITAIILMMVM